MIIENNKIQGERIYLRQLIESDASQEYCNWLNDPEVNKFLETRQSTIEELKEYIKKQLSDPNSIFFGIFDKEKDLHIGNLKLEPIDREKKSAVVGILIGNKYFWGKGLGTEAINLVVKYAFEELGLEKIELGVIANNLWAIRSYEKAGFKIDEVQKNAIRHGEETFDKIKMSIKK